MVFCKDISIMNCNFLIYVFLLVIVLDMFFFFWFILLIIIYLIYLKFFYVERKQIKEELEDQYQLILDKNVQEMEDMKKIFEEKLKEVEQKGVILICLYIVVMKLLDNNFVILIFFILEILNFLIINMQFRRIICVINCCLDLRDEQFCFICMLFICFEMKFLF